MQSMLAALPTAELMLTPPLIPAPAPQATMPLHLVWDMLPPTADALLVR